MQKSQEKTKSESVLTINQNLSYTFVSLAVKTENLKRLHIFIKSGFVAEGGVPALIDLSAQCGNVVFVRVSSPPRERGERLRRKTVDDSREKLERKQSSVKSS